MKRHIFRLPAVLLSLFAGALLLTACAGPSSQNPQTAFFDMSFSKEDLNTDYDEAAAVKIRFSAEGAQYEENGSSTFADMPENKNIVIDRSGTYVLSGYIPDGRIVVKVDDGGLTHLVLAGLEASSSSSAPLYIANGDACITLAAGSYNKLTDAQAYIYPEPAVEEPNACLYGDDDLCINGSGTLQIEGRFNNGIGTKDQLRIAGGDIIVHAANNALKGNDCVLIAGGTLQLLSEEDGVKADNDAEANQGYIGVSGGSLSIVCGDDALQAAHAVYLTGGQIHLTYEGKDINCDGEVKVADGVLKD